jgi:hypothetical protein
VKVTVTVEDDSGARTVSSTSAGSALAGQAKRVDELTTLTVVIPQGSKPPKLISVPKTLEEAVKKLVAES